MLRAGGTASASKAALPHPITAEACNRYRGTDLPEVSARGHFTA